MTSPTATAEIERLAREATDPPWERYKGETVVWCDTKNRDHVTIATAETEEDAAYIAAVSPDVVLGILAALRAAEAERDAFRAHALPGLSIKCGNDGTWLCIRASTGRSAAVHLETLSEGRIVRLALKEWCDDYRAALQSTSAKEGE